jgi:hypothetical protein
MWKWMLTLLLCALPALLGCSSFSRDYEVAIARPQLQSSITGAWTGQWISHGGHRGQLRCILTDSAASLNADAYQASFEAKFWGLFTAHYTVTLHRKAGSAQTSLAGDHDLGTLAGGIYHYEANLTPLQFNATYHSSADQGVFHLTRDPRGKTILDLSPPNPEKRPESPAAR